MSASATKEACSRVENGHPLTDLPYAHCNRLPPTPLLSSANKSWAATISDQSDPWTAWKSSCSPSTYGGRRLTYCRGCERAAFAEITAECRRRRGPSRQRWPFAVLRQQSERSLTQVKPALAFSLSLSAGGSCFSNIGLHTGRPRRSCAVEGLDPLKICRRGQSMFWPRPLKCHILSFKTVVG